MKKIFIDAGHNDSGWNTGAAANGMREQDITFEVSKYLSEIFNLAGFETKLSRPTKQTNLGTDNASSINARWQMSNIWGADYFISIHVNAGGGTGAETIYYREDALPLARTMQDVYSERMGLRNRRIWFRDNVGVVRWTNCPSILLELAFIDSPASNPDVAILQSRRKEMAQAIADGFFTYFKMDIKSQKEEILTMEKRYNTINELPSWATDTIRKLVEKKILQGDDKGLNLSEDMLRIFVIHDRAGIYNNI